MNLTWFSKDPEESAKFPTDSDLSDSIFVLAAAFSLGTYPERDPFTGTMPRDMFPPNLFRYPKKIADGSVFRWIHASKQNHSMASKYLDALCKEWTYRFGELHPASKILEWVLSGTEESLRDDPKAHTKYPPLVC